MFSKFPHKKISAFLLALLLLFSLVSCFATPGTQGTQPPNNKPSVDIEQDDVENYESAFPELDLIHMLFQQLSVYDIDEEAMTVAILKAYAEATGDIYAAYYTEEELEALTSENQGEMTGIGVSVIDDQIDYNGYSYSVLTIISVFENSPALSAGLRMGDHIYSVVTESGETKTVHELGYDATVSCIRGEEGSKASFTVLRPGANGTFEIIPMEIERVKLTTESVKGRIYEADPTIGIVKITQFDLTTPPQFKNTMDSLIAQGCTKFIFDVRYNPGGDLRSIEAVLSTFLNEGDVMITTQYKNGVSESDHVQVVTGLTNGYETCNITKEDIGKYRGYSFAVITNEYTASAAELFTSNLRDYDLATLVGTTTYGKGCMQSMYPLSYFGVSGAFKLTTAWYLPPSGENYHDIGIAPDIEVEMDESLFETYGNIYLIPDSEDPQIQAAVNSLK